MVSVQFDLNVAHPARVYNVWLGGKDHFAADRLAAQQVTRRRPEVVAGARANRAFLARVVRYLAAERRLCLPGSRSARLALADAISYRDPPLRCADCEALAWLCSQCADGLAQARDYLALMRELEISPPAL